MAKRENFYRRDPNKALSGMIGLTLEERGVYNTVIDLLYTTWRPIEDDRRFIANWCGCAVQKLNPIINRLVERGRLITFEEGGRTYLSDEAFEAERNAVKGGAGTRSGRVKVEEKSGSVEEKSAGVEQNSPLLDTENTEKQSVTPPEKTREEKKDANASSVAAATKTTKRSYPDDFEAAWRAYPHHKGRSSKPNAAAIFAKLPPDERAGLVAAINRFIPNVPEACGGKGAPDMAVWLKDGKHLNWQGVDEVVGAPERAFDGPAEIRTWASDRLGEPYARSYIDPAGWDAGDRALLAANPFAMSKLKADLAPICDRWKFTVRLTAANDPKPDLFAGGEAA